MLGTMHAHPEVSNRRAVDPSVNRKERSRSSETRTIDLMPHLPAASGELKEEEVQHQLQQLEIPEGYVGSR